MFDYDAELRHYHARLLEEVDICRDDHVLDVGCGTGQTTRAAARASTGGHALGIDISAPMLARARRLTDREALTNATFEQGDAQVHPLAAAGFTVALSRFGTMFFTDPIAAFSNIATALRPGARFVQLVWADGHRQEWRTAVQQALTGELRLAAPSAEVPTFSLADPSAVRAVLSSAGFVDVRVAEVCEPVYYGADAASALDAIRSLHMTREALRDLDDASADRALSRLRTVLEARDTQGVWFDSSAWLVTAHRG